MNPRPHGTSQKKPFSKNDYLAPLPLQTGRTPVDSLNIIWQKNEVFLDIGCYNVGSAVMVIWPMTLMFLSLAYGLKDSDLLWLGGIIIGIPTLMLLHGLLRPTPPPVRFNRQRREVCVPREDNQYWIVPWESVIAAATQHSSISQGGRVSQGLLFIGFENPESQVEEKDRYFTMGFNCGGGETAMALWECVRSYMEIGPDAIPACRVGSAPYEETQIGSIMTSLRKGDLLDVMHGVFFITVLGTYLAEKLQDMKLCPAPDLIHPDIIDWSRPLPPEQWAKRSPDLEAALAIHDLKPG
ncbi:DUF6708 domain-containing protein [Pseudomonas viridiflava]|uniref:DUF6708 domain-containing protein n=1 Tax=Pseudomonas viridiflava TaxID=33069 RepID=UPI000F062BA5|nr:DUF6708 domain-containing protein [Pseudomonas viridiflava]MEE4234363.1 DUF6708 domain-containing protein [Pseudomonas viridiflava]